MDYPWEVIPTWVSQDLQLLWQTFSLLLNHISTRPHTHPQTPNSPLRNQSLESLADQLSGLLQSCSGSRSSPIVHPNFPPSSKLYLLHPTTARGGVQTLCRLLLEDLFVLECNQMRES